MAIVIDTPKDLAPYLIGKPETLRKRLSRFKRFSHMMSDTPGPVGQRELVTFARKLGLRSEWIQDHGMYSEHFDIFDGMIYKAADLGARQISNNEMVGVMNARKDAMRIQDCEAADNGTDRPPLLALTLHAPWAWAMCYLGKPVENRDWKNGIPLSMAGRMLAIHAGHPRMWRDEVWADIENVSGFDNLSTSVHPSWTGALQSMARSPEKFQERDAFCSKIVAVCKIDRIEAPLPGEIRMISWRASNQWGIYIKDLIVLGKPVSVDRGRLGFWKVEGDVLESVRAQYRLSRGNTSLANPAGNPANIKGQPT